MPTQQQRRLLLGQGGAADGPLWQSLVRAWKLDETSGQRVDLVKGSTLTDNNTVTSDTGLVYPLAASFASANNESLSEVDSADVSFVHESFWIGAWIYLTTVGADRDLVTKWKTSPAAYEYALIYNNSLARFAYYTSSTGTTFTGQVVANHHGAPGSGVWKLVFAMYDAEYDALSIAVNAERANVVYEATGVLNGANPLHIGSRNGGGSPMNGREGPVMIGRGLPPNRTERTWMYNGGLGRTFDELSAYAGGGEPYYSYMATFKAADTKLYILRSRDGVSWINAKGSDTPAYTATTLANSVRDPAMMYRNGKYWICHTNGAFASTITKFSIISATDPIGTWTHVVDVDMTVGGTGINRVWAPKWFVDADDSVHIFVSCATSGSDSGPFQIYHTIAQNNALDTWSNPVAITVAGKSNIIDPFIVLKSGTYYLWYKDETATYIEYASSATLTGTYAVVQSSNWASWGTGVEGPWLVQLPDGTWRIYIDCYVANTGLAYSESTDNWATWSSLINVGAPFTTRHGSVVHAP